jgi:hypothetical protein
MLANGQEAGWTPEGVCMPWREEIPSLLAIVIEVSFKLQINPGIFLQGRRKITEKE